MGRNNYVDMDLYGRGFDGIFGYGAEEENKRQALMKFKAMQRFKERVKPGEYIDLDLYGRGDPRVFGPEAHVHTQKHALKLMEDVQSRKRDGHVSDAVIMFPVGLKAITRKARQLVKRISSFETSEIEASIVEPPVGQQLNNEREGATEDRVIPIVGKTQGIESTLDEPVVSNAPRRVKSKLPSEEVPPYVEPGSVARAIRSISSQDETKDGINESKQNALLFEPAETAAHASPAFRELSPQRASDSGSSNRAESSEASNLGAESNQDSRERRLGEPVSTTSEAEIARDILVGSDEEFPLSFSVHVSNRDRNDYNSTTSEEDLMVSQPDQERFLVDTAGRTGSTGNKIAGLFQSEDSDAESAQRDASEESSGETGSQMDDTYSSTEDEDVSSDEAGEVIEVSANAAEHVEGDAENETTQFSEVSNVQPSLGVREASIVKVVETGDLLMDDDLAEDSNNEIKESVEDLDGTESGVADDTAPDRTIHESDEEPGNDAEQVVDTSSSYGGSESTEVADQDVQTDASFDVEDVDGPAYVTDSDHSDEADSSSEVMSSSPEEDSDDIEIETSGNVEEDSEEYEEVDNEEQEELEENSSEEVGDERTGEYGEVRVVDSSGADMSSVEDNDATEGDEANNPQEEGDEGTSFWQRLNFFGTIVQGSWTVY